MKKELLTHLIQINDWHQVLVFTRTAWRQPAWSNT